MSGSLLSSCSRGSTGRTSCPDTLQEGHALRAKSGQIWDTILGHFLPWIVHFKAINDCKAAGRAPLPQARRKGILKKAARRVGFVVPPLFFFIRSPFRGVSFYHLFTHSAIFLSYFADILTIVALEREEIVAWGAFKRVSLIQVEFCLQCTVHLVKV